MKIGIVGHGVVGSAMSRFFSRSTAHQLAIYDKFQPAHNSGAHKDAVNACDLVFICVPTPIAADRISCDVSSVEECVNWIVPPMCIRSTIVPGTVDRLTALTGKAISFSPEYLGEQPSHPWHEEAACGFLLIGGPPSLCDLVASAYKNSGVELKTYRTTARAAELCKYMENCFLATKVAFVNQFYDIASALDVDFEELRELWLADPRIGESHTRVTGERGFRGRCLPKDVSALVSAMKSFGGAPLLEAVLDYNNAVCRAADVMEPGLLPNPRRQRTMANEKHSDPSIPYQEGFRVDQAVQIKRPSDEVYAFWRDMQNLPRVMRHVKNVTMRDSLRSHWVVEGPGGKNFEWDAEIINDEPGSLIGWRSLPGSQVQTAGSVRFMPIDNGRATELIVELQYDPPGGALGAGVAMIFGKDFSKEILDDLIRFRDAMEHSQTLQQRG